MAPLPANSTPRAFIEYTVGGQEHVLEIRLAPGSVSGDASSAFGLLAPEMANFLHTSDAVTGVRFSQAGSNLSFPVAVTAVPGIQAVAPDPDHKPNFVSFTGRSSDGRRVRATMFTQYIDLSTVGYRDNTPSGDTLALMNAITGNELSARTISGLVPVWNTYVNYGANAYYQRKARRT